MQTKFDPRQGEGKKIADRAEAIYQEAFDAFAGPAQFRHSVNYPDYHRAGLLALWQAASAASDSPLGGKQ